MPKPFLPSGKRMIAAHPRHRCPWIALAAFLLALAATGRADACSMMAEGPGACDASCGCGDSPAGGCACRRGQPDAPEPKPGQRTRGEQTDAGRDLAVGESVHDAAPRL